MRKTDDWDGEIGDGYVRIGKHVLDHPQHIEFVTACRQVNLKPYFYRGRFCYRGPAVTLPNITVISSFGIDVPMIWDNMGNEYVVYPEVSINETDEERIAAVQFHHKILTQCNR